MQYLALLRGINVGGNNKVDMKQLKAVFEQTGMTAVSTYINSGNVIFQSDTKNETELAAVLEKAIEQAFGFHVKVLIRSYATMQTIAAELPAEWVNDATMKTDVMFLWEGYDTPEVVKRVTIKPEMDRVKYVPGALLWSVDRPNVTRSGLLKIIGTDLYRHMTVRNCNTFRKLITLMDVKHDTTEHSA
ncbi:DUF1697 domain-containing protein [Streptomyces caniscabiei]|uniref:DUF1697 domain-containing protein n=1 Tax=Streptomyces caniscabiei TaxID=2746961 RepID=UPI0029A2D114|nr:DUF1697 domain-containing protein [Streptomyces caniscabiei]MDX2776440.1 DUF1697 domain-containing protein [Streptomyces caniscabiei]